MFLTCDCQGQKHDLKGGHRLTSQWSYTWQQQQPRIASEAASEAVSLYMSPQIITDAAAAPYLNFEVYVAQTFFTSYTRGELSCQASTESIYATHRDVAGKKKYIIQDRERISRTKLLNFKG